MRTKAKLASEAVTEAATAEAVTEAAKCSQTIAAFRQAQSAFFAADTEMAAVGRFTRKFSPKKVVLIEERRTHAQRQLDVSKRELCLLGHHYLDLGDGCIFDCTTQLIGLKEAGCLGKKSWLDAMSVVSQLASDSCGLSDDSRSGDWRLPTKSELSILFIWKNSGFFSEVRTFYHWSSSPSLVTPSTARLINLYDGGVYNVIKSNQYYIWPVRGGIFAQL